MTDNEPNINGINKRIRQINIELSAPFAPMQPQLKEELEELITERNRRLNAHGSALPVFRFVKSRKAGV